LIRNNTMLANTDYNIYLNKLVIHFSKPINVYWFLTAKKQRKVRQDV